MNILIPDSWLREYLVTNAKPDEIANSLSLSGPSVGSITKIDGDSVYDIEVTTNRVDMMSVYGIAREAAVILPKFGFKAKLLKIRSLKSSRSDLVSKKSLDLKIVNNSKLCKRILAVKLENVEIAPSPLWMQDKLIKVGQRPLNNLIDITNYVMWGLGHPIHAFDFDNMGEVVNVREAKKGEKITTLDSQTHKLNGGEVVFDNGKGIIVDLPGIMGTANTVVNPDTKNVLLWIESIQPEKIRKASMGLAIRTQAATLNEKSVDAELGLTAIERAVELYKEIANAKIASKLVDIYPSKLKQIKVSTTIDFINARLGVELTKNQIKDILVGLQFSCAWNGNSIRVSVPSFRSHDITIPEDIVEEVARIYGYHNLPSNLMAGSLPILPEDTPFEFEAKVRDVLVSLGGVEVYTLSMVAQSDDLTPALKLKNPLGSDGQYMRTSLIPSLINSVNENIGRVKNPYHMYELANVYLKTKGLPDEKMKLAGVFANHSYRKAKGIVERLLTRMGVVSTFEQDEASGYVAGGLLGIKKGKEKIGHFGKHEGGLISYEFDLETLKNISQQIKYKPVPKYPPQIEDLTFILPEKTVAGDVIAAILKIDKLIGSTTLTDIYGDSYTFRVWYQSSVKTLTNSEVEHLRKRVIAVVRTKFGGEIKE